MSAQTASAGAITTTAATVTTAKIAAATDVRGACLLAQTGVYEEYLTLRPIEALPGSHDLVVHSRLESAREPGALQTRYRTGIGLEALSRLYAYLGEYLASQGAKASGEVQS